MTGSHVRSLIAIGIATLATLALARVFAARPWDTAASASCEQLTEEHVAAQTAFLTAATDSDRLAAGQVRDHTFAELGMQCTWEAAQAADMQAYLDVR